MAFTFISCPVTFTALLQRCGLIHFACFCFDQSLGRFLHRRLRRELCGGQWWRPGCGQRLDTSCVFSYFARFGRNSCQAFQNLQDLLSVFRSSWSYTRRALSLQWPNRAPMDLECCRWDSEMAPRFWCCRNTEFSSLQIPYRFLIFAELPELDTR